MKTLQELLTERAEHVEAQAALIEAARDEGRDLTEDEATNFEEHETEITRLDGEIEAAEKREARAAKVHERVRDLGNLAVAPPKPPAFHGDRKRDEDDGGFRNIGELIHDLRFGDRLGRVSKLPVGTGEGGGVRVPDALARALTSYRIRAEFSMDEGAGGGFAVPTQFRDEFLSLRPEEPLMRPGATVIPPGDPADGQVSMPALDQGAKGVFGGVSVSWIAEGVLKPETDAQLLEISLQPKEVAAHVVVSDKLLRNWRAASAVIERLLRGAMIAAEEYAFWRGDGVGKPLGVLGAPGTVAVNRAVANQIAYADLVAMLTALLPESADRAVWVASQSTLPQLASIQDASGRYIWSGANAILGIPATLLGKPIYFTGKLPALGSKGDLMLVDRNYYLIKDGSGPFVAASEHVYFRNNKTVIKCFWNVDGQPWVKAPLRLEDGATDVSPHVVLDVP